MTEQESGKRARNTHQGKIHPVIMYPFTHPYDTHNLEMLYESLVKDLDADKKSFCRPITVLNRQTYYRNMKWQPSGSFKRLVGEIGEKSLIRRYSRVADSWSVDTCQMWLAGMGRAFDENKSPGDIYWLIPGDFNYASSVGKKVLEGLAEIPRLVRDQNLDLCLGEINVAPNSSKQLIDTYGTYGLLYNWFPAEAPIIKKFTEKPRTEFFAISHSYLMRMLDRRWYPYEQTLVMLIEAAGARIIPGHVAKVALGDVSDEPQGRDTLAVAMQQVERTERVLKLYWREVNQDKDPKWPDRFRQLDAQSEEVRGAALVIFEHVPRR